MLWAFSSTFLQTEHLTIWSIFAKIGNTKIWQIYKILRKKKTQVILALKCKKFSSIQNKNLLDLIVFISSIFCIGLKLQKPFNIATFTRINSTGTAAKKQKL